MPNHFLVVGLCSRNFNRLSKVNKEASDISFAELTNANLCSLAIPMPSELNGIVVSNQLFRYQHKVTKELWLEDCNGPPLGESAAWERAPLTTQEVQSLAYKYGAADWRSWAQENWGTKWGTYGTKVYDMGGDGAPVLIEFQCAWRPPGPKAMAAIEVYLCENYYLEDIRWIGHDPAVGLTVDIELDFSE